MALEELRRKIDDVDARLVSLLNERATLSVEVGRVKAGDGTSTYAPERERGVFDHVLGLNGGPLSPEALRDIYRSILAGSRALQRPLQIAYFGPAGSFTHEAAQRRFGSVVNYLPARSIPEVFEATEKGHADYGVVPVENSTEGVVTHTLDVFVDSELKICAEIGLAISQHLLSNSTFEDIKRVYSHPQAIAQCRGWLAEHLPHAEVVEVGSTSRAAQMASGQASTAAIATETAAELYGLEVVARRIEDNAANFTRFLVIGPKMSQRSGCDKTSLLFSVRDRVGALHDVLDVFLRHSINLTKIESRPSKRKVWDYLFFVDFLGHPDDDLVATALREISEECVLVKVLGAWPVEQ